MIESANPAKCGSYQLHDFHTFRRRWFGPKEDCLGTPFPEGNPIAFPEDFLAPKDTTLVPLEITEHKHDFKLTDKFTLGGREVPKDPEDILWACDWVDCGHYFVITRKLWQKQGVPYDGY